jgi:hypothetical protein
LFQQPSLVFDQLFIRFHNSNNSDESTSATLHLEVLPFCELLLEAIEKVNFIPANGHSKKSVGVLMLTTHRLVFISYAKGRDAHHVVELGLTHVLHCAVKRSERNTKLEVTIRGEVMFKFKIARSKTDDRETYDVLTRMKSEMLWSSFEDNFNCMLRSTHTKTSDVTATRVCSFALDDVMRQEYERYRVIAFTH